MSFSFGSSATPSTGFSFGGNSSSSSSGGGGGFNFGASSSSNAGSGGFNFGASSSSNTGSGGFNFGASSSSNTGSGGFNFGGNNSNSGGAFNFGGASKASSGGFGFGAASTSSSSGGFNFGQTPTTAVATTNQLKADTKFSSKLIPETGPTICKKNLKEMESFIQRQTNAKEEISDHLKNYKIDINVGALGQELSALKSDIKTQISGIQSFQEALRKELKHAEVANRNLLKFNTYGETVYLPSRYHWEKLSEFQAREESIANQITEINQYLEAEHHERDPESLQSILQDQHNALMVITSKVSTLHAMADRLREQYMDIKRRRGENVKNLFKEDEPKKKKIPQIIQTAVQIPQQTQPGTAFGVPNTQQQQTNTSSSGGFNFGNTNNSSSTGFNFGTPSTSSSTGFGFNSSSTSKKKSSQKKKKR